MLFSSTDIDGPRVIDLEPIEDERGFFARAWCSREFGEEGLVDQLVQANISYTARRGTLRGMHLQIAPHAEAKVVRCIRGAMQDVIIDLRPDSDTFTQWVTVELTADNHRVLYIPEHFAQGFLTLSDDTEVLYQVSNFYAPDHEVGLRFDDPAFAIDWPMTPTVVSAKDQQWPDFSPDAYRARLEAASS